MESRLENLQIGTYERLRNHSDLVGVTILNCLSGDIDSALEAWIREPIGTCITVLPPLPIRIMKHSARQWETIAELRVRIVENMFIHHNKRKALEVAECAYGILSGASLPESNFNGSLSPKSEHPWVVRENFPESSKLEIELFFNAHLFLRPCDGGLQ